MLKPINVAEVRFEIESEIGAEGRNSCVYRARDHQLDATLAIKRIEKTQFADVEEYFSEASLLYLSSHPNIVPVHYACQDSESIYLATPFYVDGSLKKLMCTRHLTVREIVTYITQVLSGLHNVHSKGLIHFDIKPDNILISSRGEALLADFGLAKQMSYSGVAGQDRIYGKMVPPEAFQQPEHSSQFDIYQVGLTLHRMCIGDVAFYRNYGQYLDDGALDRDRFRHAVLNGQFPSRERYPEHIPQRIIETIGQCLRTDPADRFRTALDVVNALADIDGELLDWQYEQNNDERGWSKRTGGKGVRLSVAADASSTALKINKAGEERRIREYCVNGITRQQIKRFLRGN